ncbi:uncharacterized protein LOC124150714 [Haliotis rufescens]|uniref:uncharacterized protein LOC124150714 n=1 Tax=Haliotis rufescens TaxID=6454 RepID=UPI00201F1C2C|nr:uncharacterized protein LOC124150714 [Haliotis rufescens]
MDRVFVVVIVLISCQLHSLRCDDGIIINSDEAYDGSSVTGGPSSQTVSSRQDSSTYSEIVSHKETTHYPSSEKGTDVTTSNTVGIKRPSSQVPLKKNTTTASVLNKQTVTVPISESHGPHVAVPSAATISINPLAAMLGQLLQSPQANTILGLIFGQNHTDELAQLLSHLTSSSQGGLSQEGLSELLNNPEAQAVMKQVFQHGSVGNMLKTLLPNMLPVLNDITPAQLFQAVGNMVTGSGTGGHSSNGAIFQAIMSALPSIAGSSVSAVLKNFGVDVNATDVMKQIAELVSLFREQGNITALQELAVNATGPAGMMLDVLPLANSLGQMMNPETVSDENICLADFSAYIQGLLTKQMWAIKMLDASGKPGRSILKGALQFLGNYDECREITGTPNTTVPRVVNGEYWEMAFAFPEELGMVMDGRASLSARMPGIKWGFCLPRSCNVSTVTHAISLVPLKWLGSELVSASPRTVDDWKEDASAITAIIILVLIASLSVIGTCYDVVSGWLALRRAKKYEEEDFLDGFKASRAFVSEDGNRIWRLSSGISMTAMNGRRVYPLDEDGGPNHMTTSMSGGDGGHLQEDDMEEEEQPHISNTANYDSFGRKMLLAFSIPRNAEKILSTASGEGNLGCIHGIRVLSMAWVIFGHSASWSPLKTVENIVDYMDRAKDFTMQALINATLSVDTFFLLSGCLVCYLFLKESKKSLTGRPTVKQMILYYVHRYCRLTPVYMIFIMAYTGLMRHIVEGPISFDAELKDADNCRTHWWTNLLYINNIYKNDEMCLGWSWFLANDMQFYVVAPLALLPIAFGLDALGIIVMSAFLVIHISTYGYYEYHLKGATMLLNQPDYFKYIYFVPWCRVGVYGIGLFLGYLLHKTKCKAKIPRFALVLGWQIALVIGLMCTYYPYSDWKDGILDWDLNTLITFTTLSRPGWAVFVSWIIFVCCTGNGGVVNRILSWGAWMPMGKLTYCAYLIHPALLSYTEFSTRTLVYNNVIQISYHFIGTFAVAYALAFILCVFVESPCLGLEKAVLAKMKLKKR